MSDRLARQTRAVMVCIVSPLHGGEHDAWRCRPSIARFSGWSRGASCFPSNAADQDPCDACRPDHRSHAG